MIADLCQSSQTDSPWHLSLSPPIWLILQGLYGLKRFLHDGYRTVLEDKNRRYYEKRELQVILLIEFKTSPDDQQAKHNS